MKKALIIGAAGFVGNYLIDHLHNVCKWSVCATKMAHESISTESKVHILDLNILNYNEVISLLKEIQPDYIFHLAAQSSVALSWENPELTIDVNIKGTINVLNAVKNLNLQTKILLIGSSEEYGVCLSEDGIISETQALMPKNIYAMTKAAQEMTGKIYSEAYKMHIIMIRAFNHIGPKQAPQFVVSDFCKQVAQIEKKLKEPILKVGNLSAKRDFTDVRDIVNAYAQIIEQGKPGEVYNVGSSNPVEINKILQTIISLSTVAITVEVDKAKLRPIDTPLIMADTRKLKESVNWEPQYLLKDTICDTLNYWRQNV